MLTNTWIELFWLWQSFSPVVSGSDGPLLMDLELDPFDNHASARGRSE